ncbi:MAG: Hsp20/alpha crystallin family protein [Gammaproteobacteria bacterium]|nr:Hsp20/alpha crystallin family protein [Gammaproteobacteria bacterium]MDP2140699.1 Hsp20/alpha crystallin family protein [Gammaproteobacteria bacterium]MDP2346955.1 Hsp20/alpha crystallin family protein [Gammaproteobacteria bacterium]
MSLMRHEPFKFLRRIQSDLNDYFKGSGYHQVPDLFDHATPSLFSGDWSPTVNIREEESGFVIEADIPGVDPKDVQVYMDRGSLCIKGERHEERKEKKSGYKLQESAHGTFERRFLMPETADASNITAKGRHGILTVTIAKKPANKPQLIKVES